MIQKVQCKVTILVIGFKDFLYEEISTRLYRLEERRLRWYLIETFKFLTGLENVISHSNKLIHNNAWSCADGDS